MTHHTFCHGLFFSQYCRKPHMMLLPENWAASICTVGRRPRQMRTKSARQHYFTNLFLGRLSLYLEQQISVCISTSCLPLGCPSFCPQLPFHQSGLGSSLCRLCSSCCCHIPAPPYCLNTSSTPPVEQMNCLGYIIRKCGCIWSYGLSSLTQPQALQWCLLLVSALKGSWHFIHKVTSLSLIQRGARLPSSSV